MFKKGSIKKAAALVFGAMFLFAAFNTYAMAKNAPAKEQTEIQSGLEKIDKYQAKYFEIVKRNDVLLKNEDDDKLNKEREELNNLFNEVEKQVLNKKYLKKYRKTQSRFSKCNAITTIGINDCAEKNYKAINKLLDDTYKKAESKLNFKEAEKLALSEIEWEKEVENYETTYDSMGFGTIGASIYYGYEINMREFRTLLLMMYL